MSNIGFAIYCFSEITFMNAAKLKFCGVHKCYVNEKRIYKQNMNISSSSRYCIGLQSENGEYNGVFFVDGDTYDKVKKGESFGNYGVVINKHGKVRFSKKIDAEKAIHDVSITAQKIAFQILIALIVVGVSLIYFLKPLLS